MASFRRLSLLFTAICFCSVQVAWSKATIEIKFLRYSDSCTEHIGMNKCDPYFKFCLDRPRQWLSMSPCFYGSTVESGYFSDTNNVDFSNMPSIKGIPNPWIITTDRLMDSSIFLIIQVYDEDAVSEDDHTQTWGTTMAETIKPSKNNAPWASKETSSGSHRLVFQIRIYCEPNYYNPNCTQFCLASDGPNGHYTCDPNTGAKICLPGWTGSDCVEDINECSLNYCERGTCENLQPDYLCHCPRHYKGKNCTEQEAPCDSSPCMNNALCTNTDGFSYNCICVGQWEGENCDRILNPCKSAPCQNGAKCKASADHSQYFCSCLSPYTGVDCDVVIPDVTTSTGKAVSVSTSSTTISTQRVQESTPRVQESTSRVQESTSTARESTVPESTAVTANISMQLVPTENKASEAAGRIDTSEAVDSTEEAGIQSWHGAVIAVVCMIIIITGILCLVIHRRRRKQKLLSETAIAVYHNNNNLAFENNVYNDVNTCAGSTKGRQKQHTPLPDTPTEDEHFRPTKPVFTPNDDLRVQGAECAGYCDVDVDMDTDGYMKAVDGDKYNIYTKMIEKPGHSEHAVRNIYSDCDRLRKSDKHEIEEVHYHDLDEMAMAVREYSKVVKERELKLMADCQFAVNKEVTSAVEPYATPANRKQNFNAENKNFTSPNTREETAYTDVPNNIPVSFGYTEDARKTAFNDDFLDDPFSSVSMLHDPLGSEDPYIEPINTNDYMEPVAAAAVFNSWEPADKRIRLPDLSNLSENEMSKEDGEYVDDGENPQTVSSSEGEYSVPRSSPSDESPLEKPEFQYDTPPRSGSSSLLHTKKELPWLPNGLSSAAPVLKQTATFKPPIKSRAKKIYSEGTNNTEAKISDNNNGLSLPKLEESTSDQPIDSNGWDSVDYPMPISINGGYNNHDKCISKENGKIQCNPSQKINLEDSGFSQS
ncbi:hypothetical protein BsWGS_11969 [Bradybaena similaris]